MSQDPNADQSPHSHLELELPVPPATPPPGPGASPEEKDRWWFENVYQGDDVPQFTWRAVITGGIIGMLLALSNLYTTIKMGWAFGVTITACVVAFSFGTLMKKLGMKSLTMLENNCMQSTASAAGYSTGGTVGTAFGALLLIQGAHQPWQTLVPFVFLTAALGVFLAVPFKRQMVNHEQLVFPTGVAAAETTRSLYAHGDAAARKARVLLYAIGVGAAIGLIIKAGDTLTALGWPGNVFTSIPGELHLPAWLIVGAGSIPVAGFVFEISGLLIAAGVITGMRVGVSMLLSAAVLHLVLTPVLINMDHNAVAGTVANIPIYKGAYRPTMWGLWMGTSLLVFASLTGLALQWNTVARAFSMKAKRANGDDALAKIEVPGSWMIAGLIPVSLGLVAVQYVAFGISIPLGIIAVAMSFVVALVCCRATGETDTTPIGPMGKVTQLIYSILPGARGSMSINLMAAGTTSAAGGSAADLLTDLKSGYLLGANPRRQFLAQFCGIFFGTLVIVPAWYLMVPTAEVMDKFNPPAANMWKAMAELLSKGVESLPVSARWAACIGALIGVLVPVIESRSPRARRFLPSVMGLGLGLVVYFQNALSFCIGGVIAHVWSKYRPLSAKEYMIAIASGLIAGEGLVSALSAITQTVAGLVHG
jgi:OPT family oligopeptide transporter